MRTLLLGIISCIALTATAQKLPSIQKVNLRAPSTVKTDGKPTEWGAMQAYNSATEVAYVIANDDKNLYLTVQAKDKPIITKIMNGAVTFTFNGTEKKTKGNTIAISYPVFDKGSKPHLDLSPNAVEGLSADEQRKIADSLTGINNQKMLRGAKLIKVIGVKGLDTLISIYNEDGIKAASMMDNQQVYTYELAISLEKLGLDVKKASKFFYNVRLNPMEFDEIPGITITKGADGSITSMHVNSNVTKLYGAATVANDFWGEYQLVGKE